MLEAIANDFGFIEFLSWEFGDHVFRFEDGSGGLVDQGRDRASDLGMEWVGVEEVEGDDDDDKEGEYGLSIVGKPDPIADIILFPFFNPDSVI